MRLLNDIFISILPVFTYVDRQTVHLRGKRGNLDIANKNSFNSKKGFTLIEMLVAIAIVGILASVVIYSSANAFKRSRDTQRKSDLKSISDALEFFYSDHGIYPPDTLNHEVVACPYDVADIDNSTTCIWGINPITDTNGSVYTSRINIDPKSDEQSYYYDVSPTLDRYVIYARLENPEDSEINSDVVGHDVHCNAASAVSTTICNYGVSSPDTPLSTSW